MKSDPSRRPSWVGPLFQWELSRLARRGQDHRGRAILAASLFATLCLFTAAWFPSAGLTDLISGTQTVVKQKDSARFAEQFSLALLLVQMLVMCLLAPTYAAGSIAEEKERKTFGYLLATDLSNREIVLGKFFARVVFLLGIMLAGLPVFALVGLSGGIDPVFLFTAYLLTAGTTIMVAAMSFAAAVYAGSFRGALFRAYGMTALYCIVGGVHPAASPFAVLVYAFYSQTWPADWFIGLFGGYVLLQLLIAAFALWVAIAAVRGKRPTKPNRDPFQREKSRSVAVTAEELVAEEPTDEPVATAARLKRPVARPAVDPGDRGRPRRRPRYDPPDVVSRPRVFADDPFYWKERYTLGYKRTSDEESLRGVMVVAGVMAAGGVVLAALIAITVALANPARAAEMAAGWLVLAGTGGMFGHLLVVGAAAVQSVLRERQRQTLESLLTVPAERTQILWPKWRVAIGRGWWWGGPGAAALVGGLLLSNVSVAALPAALYLPAAAGFAVSFGIWLSVRFRAVARAMMVYLSFAAVLVVLPLIAWWFFDADLAFWAAGMLAVAAVAAGGGGWYFWKQACHEFERDGRE